MEKARARPTVAVVGAGAVGSFFAAHLIAAGSADVTVCVRTPFEELVVESELSGESQRFSPRLLTEPGQVAATVGGPVDWLLVATKAHQTAGAAGWLAALAGPATRVVVLQNGVEHEARVRPWLAHAETEIVPAVVYCGAEVVGPGHIVHRSNGFLIVPAGPTGAALAALYQDSPAGIHLTEDFTSAVWQKLCANVVANGITALTERRVAVMRRPDVSAVGRALVGECLAVARAEGAAIDDGYVDLLLGAVVGMPDGAGTSMLYDRLAHRPMEQDALYGAVVRVGQRHDIATPLHAAFLALLAAIGDEGAVGSGGGTPA
jgi:2-dehydropantoate 2-reductase